MLAAGFLGLALGRERGTCEASAAAPTLAKNLPLTSGIYAGRLNR